MDTPGSSAASYADARPPVLIIDDHEMFAVSLGLALEQHGIASHPLKVGTPDVVLATATGFQTGLVVLDLFLGLDHDQHRIDGVELIRPLRAAGWTVLAVSGSLDQAHLASAIVAGAVGLIDKGGPFDTLVTSVRTALDGGVLMTPQERARWFAVHDGYQRERRCLRRRLERLSPREREVLTLLARGQRPQQITEHFTVSITTVRTQIRAILTKLEVTNQLEAVALAHRARWW